MKTIIQSSALVLSFVLFSFTATNPGSLPIGAALPKADLSMKDVSGKTISLQEATNTNGLLVMFSCNSCPVVIANQSRTKQICQYAADNKIGVTVINSNEGGRSSDESYESMQAYAKEQSYKWFYLLDKSNVVADAFGANRTPECFLFDKNNKLVYHGAIDDSPGDISGVKRTYLKQAINELVAGKNITVKESRSVGCSIFRG
ncbi:MAG TPA: thioredoxin family protein [Puia sp.]|nr:thioredoxin family protein [Puia sp.]